MLSQEMLLLGKKSSAIREIFEYSNKRRSEIGAENVYDFSLGNPSIPSPQLVTDTMLKLLTETDPVTLHGYTSAAGDITVRRTIAEKIEKRFGIKTDPALIYMTCGAAASLTITLKALTVSGDEVILLAPYFPEYQVFVKNAGAVPVDVMCKAETFDIDFDVLKAAINPKTRAIIVNSPNNPTGAVLSEDNIRCLSELLEEKSKEFGRPITIISDEPYRELVYGGVEVPWLPHIYRDTLVCYSFSKSLSTPGERIGYVYVPVKATDAGPVYAAVAGAGRSLGYVCAPALFQRVAAACCNLTADLSVYDTNRKLLCESLQEMGYECPVPQGAFYIFPKALEADARAFCEKAREFDLLLVAGDSFGGPGHVRISYCVPTERIERSLPKFRALAAAYGK